MKGIVSGIQGIIDIFISIWDAIKLCITFLINLVKGLFQMLTILKTTITNSMNFTLTLPSWLIAFASATIAVSILYIIVGRESGKSK